MFVGDNFVGISAEEEKTLATVRTRRYTDLERIT